MCLLEWYVQHVNLKTGASEVFAPVIETAQALQAHLHWVDIQSISYRRFTLRTCAQERFYACARKHRYLACACETVPRRRIPGHLHLTLLITSNLLLLIFGRL